MGKAFPFLTLLVVVLLFGCESNEKLISSLKVDPRVEVKYSVLTSERMDFSGVPRLAIRIKVPRGLSREGLEAQVRHAAYVAYKKSSVTLGALAVFAYDSDDINGGFSAASFDFAPYGKWEEANHRVSLEHWSGTIEFAEGYFTTLPEIFPQGTTVILHSKNQRPIFLSKSASSWMPEDLLVEVTNGTNATIQDVQTFSYAGGFKAVRYQVKVEHDKKAHIGWVHKSDVKIN